MKGARRADLTQRITRPLSPSVHRLNPKRFLHTRARTTCAHSWRAHARKPQLYAVGVDVCTRHIPVNTTVTLTLHHECGRDHDRDHDQ